MHIAYYCYDIQYLFSVMFLFRDCWRICVFSRLYAVILVDQNASILLCFLEIHCGLLREVIL